MADFVDLGGRLINRALIATVTYEVSPVVAYVSLAVPIYERSEDGTGGTDLYRLTFHGEQARLVLHALMPEDVRFRPARRHGEGGA